MSTEPKPPATATAPTVPAPPPEKVDPNALATAITSGWEQFTRGQLISYRLMAVILLVVAGAGTAYYIWHSNRKVDSGKWADLDAVSGTRSVSALKEYAEKNPNTPQARLALLEGSRVQLGAEGIDQLALTEPARRKEAVESIERARDSFLKLADEFKDDPVIRVECLMSCAKAEAALVGMLKDGSTDQYRGDPKTAVEYLDKVAEAAGDTDWGKDAKKLADALRNEPTQKQVVELQRSAYLFSTPVVPGLDPKAPTGGPGGLGGLGGIPGFPGGP